MRIYAADEGEEGEVPKNLVEKFEDYNMEERVSTAIYRN